VFNGIVFVLGGLAILSEILDVLAAQLLALMLLVFNVIVLAPMIFVSPRERVAWVANAYTLAAVGAALILADWLAARRLPIQNYKAQRQRSLNKTKRWRIAPIHFRTHLQTHRKHSILAVIRCQGKRLLAEEVRILHATGVLL